MARFAQIITLYLVKQVEKNWWIAIDIWILSLLNYTSLSWWLMMWAKTHCTMVWTYFWSLIFICYKVAKVDTPQLEAPAGRPSLPYMKSRFLWLYGTFDQTYLLGVTKSASSPSEGPFQSNIVLLFYHTETSTSDWKSLSFFSFLNITLDISTLLMSELVIID